MHNTRCISMRGGGERGKAYAQPLQHITRNKTDTFFARRAGSGENDGDGVIVIL